MTTAPKATLRASKDQREMAKRCIAAGCTVEPSKRGGTSIVVVTPSGERVVMSTLKTTSGARNFVAYMRRLGVIL